MDSKMKKAKSRPSDAREAPSKLKLYKRRLFGSADSPSKSKSTPSQSHRADPPSIALSNQVYLFFWHAYSPVMYSLYKIDIPRPLPPPPAKASQDLKLSSLRPMLTFKTGKYPDRMCCVQLGSKLYFLGGEFNITNPYIDADVLKELQDVKRDVFPADVSFLDLANYLSDSDLSGENVKWLFCKPMNSGKASPQAFVADGKIYVIGSTIQMNIIDKSKLKDLDLESFAYFEVYDPEVKTWTILPNPPIRDMSTKWVGHTVVGKTALLVAWQRGKECVYFFDLGTHQWKKYASLPSYPGNFTGRIEYVEDTVYGCYGSTIAAIAPLAAEEDEEEEEEEEEEEGEEIEKVQRLLKHHGLHLVSEEMGMDAIFNVPPPLEMDMDATFNVPPQMQSSSSLLHLGNRYFCYVKAGMPMNGVDIRQFITIVLFQALKETYKEDATRFFRAKFLHSAHYVVHNLFPSEGFIEGFFFPGLFDLKPPEYLNPLVNDIESDIEDFISRQLAFLSEVFGLYGSARTSEFTPNNLVCIPMKRSRLIHSQHPILAENLVQQLHSGLEKVVSLRLDGIQITSLPDEMGQLVRLKQLSISGNLLPCLPETIGSLHNLLLLNVSNNKLKSLPESIGNCFSLEELQANDNLIEDLPASICNLIHLKSLWLDNNYLNQIPLNLLKDCKVLQNISLHGNPISMDQIQQMEGFQDFEARRKKFVKQIDSNVMIGSKGLDEGVDL